MAGDINDLDLEVLGIGPGKAVAKDVRLCLIGVSRPGRWP